MTKIIALTNQKGGVGKTTSAVNIAASLAVSEIKTLLIDMDPQANTSTGIAEIIKKRAENTIYETLVDEIPIKDTITKTTFNHLDAILSTNDLVGAEIELVSVIARELELKKALAKVKRRYDYIIIDCPPSLGLLTLNSLTAANALIIPIQAEYYALEGLGQLLNTIRLVQQYLNKNLKIAGVLVTMFDGRLNLSRQVLDEVKSYFGDKLFKTVIHRNVRLSEAPSFGKPALLYDANSVGAKDYMALIEEIIKNVY
ncbi:MAG TPA: ParA family protein [Candidatus Marinimicrobia bacterium]|jgi:chromosome partitioning protein|nr:ParA family protein [Candidatus Neomarinimicrobiota bacterium]HIN26052.1 ParA family protein [Candidatus Neomarinimicrobiota bacterium]